LGIQVVLALLIPSFHSWLRNLSGLEYELLILYLSSTFPYHKQSKREKRASLLSREPHVGLDSGMLGL